MPEFNSRAAIKYLGGGGGGGQPPDPLTEVLSMVESSL